MAKSLLICTSATSGLKLNESVETQKYVLEGVFAELDVMNRNQRIYPKDEYLKHLQYLRNDIKSGEPLLGELDHPEDRFEVKLKEASHRIIDLWYDSNNNVVMGKIELLNTPNGKLAQSMIDQGIPLHISSRAAGTVNSDNTVSIQQIYTYDLVCKPGFAGAVLHRVNESVGDAYSNDVQNFLVESNKAESLNTAPQYGIINENVSVSEIKASAPLRKEAKAIQESNTNNMNLSKLTATPLLEADDDEKDDEKKEEDSENSDEGVKIISVRAETEGDDMIKGVKAEYEDDADKEKDEDSEESEDEKDKDSESDTEEETKDESVTVECGDSKECKDKDKDEAEMLTDCKKSEVDKLTSRKDKFENKIDKLIQTIKSKSECKSASTCESLILAQYPVSRCMTEENFAAFSSLTESQKNKVISYLQDNNFNTVGAINENWKNGVNYVSKEPVWLKYAPSNYRELYESASEKVKKSLATSAEYFIFESQTDVNIFWENSNLQAAAQNNIINESFIKNMPKFDNSVNESAQLPYSADFIQAVADMACEYNY